MVRHDTAPLFDLDPASGTGKQTQIREHFVKAILGRRILAGEALPSTRELARRLEVSRNTVILAYQALIDNGYIEAVDRSGFIVSGDAPVPRIAPAGEAPPPVGAVDWNARFTSPPEPLNVIEKPLDWREHDYPFTYGQMDQNLFSHSEWRDCSRQALGARDFGMTAGDFGQHDDPLLVDYITSNSLPRRGFRSPTSQVIVTLGAQNALFLLAQLLVDGSRKVVVEEPFYPDLRELLRRRTPHLKTLPVDDGGIVLDEATIADADIVIVTPSHQCPTTATLAPDRRSRLMELAVEHDVLIIEDDYEFEMNFLEPPSPALKSMDGTGHVVYVGSFSKSLFPGLRLGYLVGAEELVAEVRKLRHLMLRHPPGQTQRTAAYFMALGHYDAQIRRLRRHFETRRKLLHEALASEPLLEESGAHFGGTSFWVKGPEWLDSRELAARAAENGVLIESGHPFFAASPPPENFFRLAYSSIGEDRIVPGFNRLMESVRALAP